MNFWSNQAYYIIILFIYAFRDSSFIWQMPPSSRKQQIAAAHKKVQNVLTDKCSTLSSGTVADNLWDRLQVANLRIEELEQQLAQKDSELCRLQSELERSNQKLQKNQEDSALWKAKQGKTYHELRMQRQTTKRGQRKMAQLQKQLDIIKTAEKEASKQFLGGSCESYQAIISLQQENKRALCIYGQVVLIA